MWYIRTVKEEKYYTATGTFSEDKNEAREFDNIDRAVKVKDLLLDRYEGMCLEVVSFFCA